MRIGIGTALLGGMLEAPGRTDKVTFSKWATQLVQELEGVDSRLTGEELKWIWNSVVTEPRIREKYDEQLYSWKNEARELPPLQVLPENSLVGLYVGRTLRTRDNPFKLNSLTAPDVVVVLKEPLCLKYVKDDELEFNKADCTLKVKISKLPGGLGSLEAEAAAFKVERQRIEYANDELHIKSSHLNEAKAMANNRLHPKRTQSGGSIYFYAAQILKDDLIPLDYIRKCKSKEFWDQLFARIGIA